MLEQKEIQAIQDLKRFQRIERSPPQALPVPSSPVDRPDMANRNPWLEEDSQINQ